ncbi:MAG: DNA internalization-related competence protein ComEC/Rec2 [Betaproteobacteria bacterium]|nr:DNA internalization-related competence protein ComEC/Rec2 [Betaproteobacteria bacterium]
MSVHGVALAALAGLGLLLMQPQRWPADVLALAGVAALLAALGLSLLGVLLARCLRPASWPSSLTPGILNLCTAIFIAAAAGLLMASWGSLRAGHILAAGIAPEQEAQPVVAHFQVHDLPVFSPAKGAPGDPGYRPASWRFEAEVYGLSSEPGAAPTALARPFMALISWAARADGWLPPMLAPGDRWQATLSFRAAAGSRNLHGFDFETWLFENRIRAVGRVSTAKKDPLPRPVLANSADGFIDSPAIWIDQARDTIRKAIGRALPEARHAGVMSGLVVGDQRAIDSADWSVFSVTGVSHLMSISGMHVTMFAMMARLGVRVFWSGLGRMGLRAALYMPVPVVCAVAASLAAIGYALLAGFNIPAQRTAVMVTVAALASLTGLRAQRWGVIALTLLVVLIMDPTAPLAPGFWLSFFAVAILFGLADRKTAIGSATVAQAAITLGIAPLTIAFFQQVSVVGPLANALAIPVVTFLVTPLAMVGAVTTFAGFDSPLVWGHVIFDWLFSFLLWCSDWPWASLAWHAPPLWASILASVGVLLALNESLPRWRHLAWLGLSVLWVGGAPAPAPGTVTATFLDVGQGSAVILRTARHTLVYDTGPSMGRANAAERIVIPQLYAMGLRRIDGLVVSHGDDDHASGLAQLVQSHRPPWIATSMAQEEMRTRVLGHLPATNRCQLGEGWVWDGVWFRFVYPFGAMPEDPRHLGKNEDSCVLEVIDAAGRRILLTGDIPQLQEEELISRTNWLAFGTSSRQTQPMVLLAAHHGSRGSSSEVFLRALQPAVVVFQSGYRSRFNHPHPEVLSRLRMLEIPSVRTDLQGDLQMHWQGERPVFLAAADLRRRFWHPRRWDHRLGGDQLWDSSNAGD